jgi:hypothetical protein
MFRDKSLIPAETIRLAALGLLAEQSYRYADLAQEIRHFTLCVAGPSLDLMGTSLELLRYEGLVAAIEGQGMADNATLEATSAGMTALHDLLQAPLRAPLSDLNRLTLLLKLRFLHHLPTAGREAQIALIAGSLESELARLQDLRHHHAEGPSLFLDWLDHDIAALAARVAQLSGGGTAAATPPDSFP